ncbi:putative LOC107387928-like protein [Nothobranchius furzeri]|uniref:LOC107387928-like protein n=2 Tax=Nothobranchius furzeri TaxID=105023 RepID=A0A9D3BC70_NOTFU|nr:putative LOC107387928-like protein [Nothobranchius furzeri]
MDPTEDLSARVLLKRILSTQSPQTPVTRSQSQEVSTSGLRRSSRQSRRRDAETKTPQDILRRSLRQNIRESIARKSQPPTDRRTVSVMLSRVPSSTSMLLSDVATPRHLLRNILQTDPVKSPVVHKTEPPKEPEPQSAEETTRTHPSTELSELELPDITIGNIGSVAKGLSRKRPCRSLNVTAFEKRLKAVKDVEEGVEDASYDHSSLSLSSSTSLTLKTPFADVETEKRGLQRKVSNRRKVSEEDFGAAVSKRQMGDVSSHGFMEGNLSEVTNFEGFTLGPSKLGEADIMNCNTALYDLPDAMVSGFSVVATEDKHSGMSSQLQDVVDAEQEEELGEMAKDTADMFPSEEKDAASSEVDENASDVLMQEDVAEFQAEQSKANVADDAEVMSTSEEEEAAAESETDDGAECEEVEAQTGEKRVSDDDFTEEEEAAAESETDDGAECEEVEAQTGEKRVSDDDFTEEEEAAAESETGKTDDGAEEVEAQTGEEGASGDDLTEEEEVSPDSQTEEEQGVAETQEHVPDSQSEDIESFLSEEEEDAQDPLPEHAVASVPFQGDDEDEAQSEDEEDVATSQTEDDNDEQREEEDQALEHMEQDSSHISRRARRSEGVPVVPVPEVREDAAEASEAGWSKAHTSTGVNASAEVENHARRRTRTGSSASSKLSVQDEGDVFDTENVPASGTKASFPCLELTQDIQVDEHRSNDSSEEDAGQEDECDDDLDEEEDLPCKTPAFVKEKKIFLSDPAASPFVFKNVPTSGTSTGLPAAKPKQVRPRKTRTASKKGVLPKSYLLSTFRHFAKTKVSADVYPILNEIMDKFFDRMAEDLETYAAHANRKTIEFEDAVLLLKRQGHVNENMPVEVLIEKYLRMDQRKILIPIATSGNVVIPKMR